MLKSTLGCLASLRITAVFLIVALVAGASKGANALDEMRLLKAENKLLKATVALRDKTIKSLKQQVRALKEELIEVKARSKPVATYELKSKQPQRRRIADRAQTKPARAIRPRRLLAKARNIIARRAKDTEVAYKARLTAMVGTKVVMRGKLRQVRKAPNGTFVVNVHYEGKKRVRHNAAGKTVPLESIGVYFSMRSVSTVGDWPIGATVTVRGTIKSVSIQPGNFAGSDLRRGIIRLGIGLQEAEVER